MNKLTITTLLIDRNFNTTFFILQDEKIQFYTSIFLGFLVMGAIALIEKGGTLPLQRHLSEHNYSMFQVNYLPIMQITNNEVGCLGANVMKKVEDSVKKGKKSIFNSTLVLNLFRLDPGNRRDLLGLECALSSFKGEIPYIVCKMPSALARTDHPRPNIFQKDKYSIGSVALAVKLF